MLMSWAFTMMHDASHFALWGVKLDMFLNQFWNGVALWDPAQWFAHHVVYHHSFTGDPALDPDMHHGCPVMRTTKTLPKYMGENAYWLLGRPCMQFFGMIVLPGMYVGQVVMYAWMNLTPQGHRQIWTFDMSSIER